jgi:DNA-binding NarL/FixJ family response regulator
VSGGRVLIIDDQPDLVAGVKAVLEMEGIEVIVHSSLITLPLLLRAIDPDVILLDLSMPALSGTAAFANRRCLKTDAPMILFSGRGEPELALLVEELGADGYLCKSDDAGAMVHRIKTWILNRRALLSA